MRTGIFRRSSRPALAVAALGAAILIVPAAAQAQDTRTMDKMPIGGPIGSRGISNPLDQTQAMKRFERNVPGAIALHDRVAERPNIAAYLASDRRIAFNEEGIFRRYKALDL